MIPFSRKLKQIVLSRKFIVSLLALWVYVGVFYYLQLVNILNFKGWFIVVFLAIPMFLAMVGIVELVVYRVVSSS